MDISGVQNRLVQDYKEVFTNSRSDFRDFLSNIFKQLNEEKFFNLIDTILKNDHLTDEELYRELQKKIGDAKFGVFGNLKAILNSLSTLKNDLSTQVSDLLGKETKVEGYVEIGYPGRMVRPIKKKIPVSGKVTVVNDQERFSDYVQSGFPRPYKQFVKLNDYAPISENDIPSNSVDLVTCFIGLHHAPEEKVDAFIGSIKRILKPGGSFILMDHDAKTENLQRLIRVVHSVFNAATGVTWSEEKNEVRNFQSLDHWKGRIEAVGLQQEKTPLMRKGDSTLNSTTVFKKVPTSLEELKVATRHTNHAQIETFQTSLEWHIVRISDYFAKFVETKPVYHFPFFQQIRSAWKVFADSWNAARNYGSFWTVLTSSDTLMNLFLLVMLTIEFGVKGLLYAPLSLVRRTKILNDPSPCRQKFAKAADNYAKFIVHTPFYSYSYMKDVKEFWKAFKFCRKDVLDDLILGIAFTIESLFKALISSIISLTTKSEALKESDTITVIAKMDETTRRLGDWTKYWEESVDARIKRISSADRSYDAITLPRYKPFKELLRKVLCSSYAYRIVSIAGQSVIQVDIRKKKTENLELPNGVKTLYHQSLPGNDKEEILAVAVEIEHLRDLFDNFTDDQIEYIHDF